MTTALNYDVRQALILAREALSEAPQVCRFHGENFERLGIEPYEQGLPRCDSCKQPWRVTRAIAALKQVMPA